MEKYDRIIVAARVSNLPNPPGRVPDSRTRRRPPAAAGKYTDAIIACCNHKPANYTYLAAA